jgi:hypothetical protein
MAKENDTVVAEKSATLPPPAKPIEKPIETVKARIETLPVAANKPANPIDPKSDGPGKYRVTLGMGDDVKSEVFEAEGRNHAWALFCDAMKSWPPPKRSDRKIERIG